MERVYSYNPGAHTGQFLSNPVKKTDTGKNTISLAEVITYHCYIKDTTQQHN